MSDNIGKHLFHIRRYGITYSGEIVKETEKTWLGRSSILGNQKLWRYNKDADTDIIVNAVGDPQRLTEIARSAWESHREFVAAAQDILRAAKRAREKAAITALLEAAK